MSNYFRFYDYCFNVSKDIFTTDNIGGTLKNKFNLEADFDCDDIISLLYYFRYLTIGKKGYGSMVFRILIS